MLLTTLFWSLSLELWFLNYLGGKILQHPCKSIKSCPLPQTVSTASSIVNVPVCFFSKWCSTQVLHFELVFLSAIAYRVSNYCLTTHVHRWWLQNCPAHSSVPGRRLLNTCLTYLLLKWRTCFTTSWAGRSLPSAVVSLYNGQVRLAVGLKFLQL